MQGRFIGTKVDYHLHACTYRYVLFESTQNKIYKEKIFCQILNN